MVNLEERDRAVRRQIEAAERDGLAILDRLLILCQNGTAVCQGQHDRGLNFICGLLLVRAFNSLWRARQDLAHGYPIQAISLARSAFEDWVAVEWIEHDAANLPFFLGALVEEVELPRDDAGNPRFVPGTSRMLAALDDSDERRNAKQTYDLLSKFAHPRGTSLRWQFSASPEAVDVHAGPYIEGRDIQTGLYFLVDVVIRTLSPLERLQDRWLGNADADWVHAATEVAIDGLRFIDSILAQVEAQASQ